jgi:hypothetical protein
LALVFLLSTGTSTYHLCALIIAAVLAADSLLRAQRVAEARALLIVFTVLCLVTQSWIPEAPSGWRILTAYPRVYALAAFWLLMVAAQRRLGGPAAGPLDRPRALRFAAMFAGLVVASSWSWLRHFDGQFANYPQRLARADQGWPAAHPAADREAISFFTRMDASGYVIDRTPAPVRAIRPAGTDVFRPTVAPGRSEGWAEVADAGGSRIVRFPTDTAELSVASLPTEIADASAPVVSADASRLGFIRARGGRGQLWLLERATGAQRPVTGADWDVLDFGFLPDNRLVFAGRRTAGPGLFVVGANMTTPETPAPLPVGDRPVRYPAVSPDGRWLAYAELERGSWQLWLMELDRGQPSVRRRLTGADCNNISPAWRPDSRRLIYASDCARGVGLTTLAELRVVP